LGLSAGDIESKLVRYDCLLGCAAQKESVSAKGAVSSADAWRFSVILVRLLAQLVVRESPNGGECPTVNYGARVLADNFEPGSAYSTAAEFQWIVLPSDVKGKNTFELCGVAKTHAATRSPSA
jgi:hypothetical protein